MKQNLGGHKLKNDDNVMVVKQWLKSTGQ